jgi:hypothetical protein
MLSLQAYSPARVLEVWAVVHDGNMLLVVEVSDTTTRITTTKLEIVRITKKLQLIDRMLNV